MDKRYAQAMQEKRRSNAATAIPSRKQRRKVARKEAKRAAIKDSSGR